MVEISCSFSTFFIRDKALAFAGSIHDHVWIIDGNLNGTIFLYCFFEVYMLAVSDLMLALLVDGQELNALKSILALAIVIDIG